MSKVCSSPSSNDIHFFVELISGELLYLHAHPKNTIRSIHEKIYHATGIPLSQQRLVYHKKQLHWDCSLSRYKITNNSTLRLVEQIKKTTQHPLIADLLYKIRAMCKSRNFPCDESTLTPFSNIAQKIEKQASCALFYPDMFVSSGVPKALVMLYISPHDGNKARARNYIQDIFTSSKDRPDYHEVCAPISLQFCKLLRRDVTYDDPLYIFCRTTLASMLEHLEKNRKVFIAVQDIFSFVDEVATKLSESLVSSMELSTGPSSTDVYVFNIILRFMMNKIVDPKDLDTLVPMQYHPWYDSQVGYLNSLYLHLLATVKMRLTEIENNFKAEQDGGWDQYLPMLNSLHYISQLYGGEEETFCTNMRPHKFSLCNLVVRHAKRGDNDYTWILKCKDLIGFEKRRDLVMMLLPEVTQDNRNRHEMLINRSNLLAESFESITGANKESLCGPIYIRFKNEEANGPGVLREWFMFVCQALFNPQNALFIACPTDQRRFFPNPASKINPGHLAYFKFAGRMIALALVHKMQVGITFARAFCLQLAGSKVSLEHIEDVDPYLYNSCKQILEMDPCAVDVLGLTFTWEFEELGVKKVVKLKKDGKQKVVGHKKKGKQNSVDSKNREEYINLIITHQFEKSIADQLDYFSQGFVDIVKDEKKKKLCFEILDLEYLDQILCGSESDISVDDWEAHTQYKGYKENDPQIYWFWQIVREMSVEKRQILLFFWTSVKYLPVEGFQGLASKLYIIKSDGKYDRLPSSHTCFYEICIPAYPSMAVMQERLNIITQEYIGCSFGAD